MSNRVGWYSDVGNGFPEQYPPVYAYEGTGVDLFTYNPLIRCETLDTFSDLLWSIDWVPLTTDAAPPYTLEDGDTAGVVWIRPTPFNFEQGTLTLHVSFGGVPLEGSPLTLTISSGGPGAYGAFAWSYTSSVVIPVGPGGAPPIPTGTQTLLEPPDENGYSVIESSTALLNAELDGGSPRTRLDEIGGSRLVNLQWSGQAKRFQTIRDFFRQNVALNCPQFALGLIIDTAEYRQFLCNLIPGSVKVSTPVGIYWVIQAQLEVQPDDNEIDFWPGGGGGGNGPNQVILLYDDFTGEDFSVIEGHVPNIGSGVWTGTGGFFTNKLLISSDFFNANITLSSAVFPANKTVTIELDLSNEVDLKPYPGWAFYFANNTIYINIDDEGLFRVNDANSTLDYFATLDVSDLIVKITLAPTVYTVLFNGAGIENAPYTGPNTFADGDEFVGAGAVLNGGVALTDYVRVRYNDPE